MKQQIEGSQAVAKTVAMCRPEVAACYPISPQTHIVETLSCLVKAGEVGPCQFLNVESEFGALSVLIGASAAGARTYTATTSQGLLFMAEAVYNAAGLGLPIVMTIANRAVGAPINIWNDHSDSMALRDSGWIQLFAEDNQEAVDLHIQAFRLAESLSCPVMVCMDGYILTHAVEAVDLPTQEQVDFFLPPYEPVQMLDPADPVSIGSMVGPDAFMEVRYLAHHKHLQALEALPRIQKEFQQPFGRPSGGLLESYQTEGAETIIVALGSVNGTIKDAVDDLRKEGLAVGAVKIVSYRPFPKYPLRQALGQAKRVIVVEKDLSVGKGGIVSSEVKMALRHLPVMVETVIAGLGGRAIPKASIVRVVHEALSEEGLEEPHFLDLNWDVINHELVRQQAKRRSGPTPENLLREAGTFGVKAG
ncbi:transketolase C-terminal domain-containing protein [Candidatus Nitronereus thalassa]|uniref:Transketolase C-terminal domain-containing protein n=1 Tax=Candidatus Nitronereus thalassa TaxID=3020898 RepID=A0ABU3K935_9BACT|nr:transketolase C-terminal domain-containing protein [Candidatus Nitronereus thalassa]MDT7042872.1 transketolase C-terminal domain-containing protein [Candidatus Nitronereus thalassa]